MPDMHPEAIPLSLLNALEYCPRRFHYEFVQGEMLVNEFVLEGTLQHRRTDIPGQQTIGNDLITPIAEFRFPGLKPGDRWCVTTHNWLRAHEAGAAAYVVLAATHERALEVVPLDVLRQYAVDVPADPGPLNA